MSISTDKTPIDEIKEYLNWRYSEVYSTDLFAPVDYDEVTDKIGGVVLSRISADISRRNALSILEWINENIETKQDAPITPEFLEGLGFSQIREIAAYPAYILNNESLCIWVCVEKITSNKTTLEKGVHVSCGNQINRKGFYALPHIRTQSQLTNLITALFGGGE